MAKKKKGTYKRAFFTGLATLLPTILTMYIVFFCYSFLEQRIARPINQAITGMLETKPARDWYWQGLLRLHDFQLDEIPGNPPHEELKDLDDPVFSQRLAKHVPWWLGFILAVALVLVVGFLFKGYLGRQLVRAVEVMILRIPVVKVIYPYAKQVTEFFFEEKKQITYESAVAVEYPRRGVYSLGFVTNEGFRDVSSRTGEDMVSIFIPSSPTPVTGYTIQVSRKDIISLNTTVDEALRYTISGGVILPPNQLPPLALKTKKVTRVPPEELPDPAGTPESRPQT